MNKITFLSKLYYYNRDLLTDLVSVILPTYNRNYIIWKTILSVLKQTYLNLELIIVDSGNDNTKKVVEQFTDHRINYIKVPKKLNPSSARNLGLQHSKGNYICYIDSDVIYHPEFIEYILISLSNNQKKVIAYCAKNKVIFEYNNKAEIIERIERIDCCRPVSLKKLWHLEEIIDTNTIMLRRNILDVVGQWDERCNKLNDWEFIFRIYQKYPNGFLHIPRVLVDYTQIKGPLSNGVHRDSDSTNAKKYVRRKHSKIEKIIINEIDESKGLLLR